ncbi:MAG TPA: substrate-binding domain-containing protein [Chthonomonadaceae bacterium]|nr:substrate-binding domain-containing protein [Chthonomonadaceae bacterium]
MSDTRGAGNKSPLLTHIITTLEERIRTGTYPGGRWLPSERELCSEFDVSRATLRQALVALERSDLVIRSAGCRPLIRALTSQPAPRNATSRRTIGLLVKDEPKYSGISLLTRGVRDAVNPDAFRLLVGGAQAATLQEVAHQEAQTLQRMIQDRDVSGIIVWYSGTIANLPVFQAVLQANIPLVFVDREPPDGIEADVVSIDNQRAAREAVQYLIHRGHQRIAHITNPEPVSTLQERLAGYEEALNEAKIPLDRELILTGRLEWTTEEGASAAEMVERLTRLSEPPTAVFAATDFIALDFVRALQQRGLRVPEDMAVIGFDDLEQWLLHKPFLTTVRQPFERIGYEATRLLIKRLESGVAGRSRHLLLEAPLIVRDSA